MRTIMMSGFLMLMGCATTGGGVNTTFYRVNADDLGGKMHRFDATKVPISRWSE